MALLTTHTLLKTFGGVRAVDGVDISFDPGTITALVGPNGSGKTTLINTITGVLPIDGGTIELQGSRTLKRIQASDIASYGITRTFQSVRLIPQLSVMDNILVVLTKRTVWGALFEKHTALHVEQAEHILRKIGLWEKREDLAENLSYGQRKLLEIARAVSMKADIYFFDEPFAGLFSEIVKIVSSILTELKDSGAAVVLVEHNMNLVRELADYCYVLDSGKILAHGTPEVVLQEPQVIEAYLGK